MSGFDRDGRRHSASNVELLAETTGRLIPQSYADSRMSIITNPLNNPGQSSGTIRLVLRSSQLRQEYALQAIRESSPSKPAVIRLHDVENYIITTTWHEIKLAGGKPATLYLSTGPQTKSFNETLTKMLLRLNIGFQHLKCLGQLCGDQIVNRTRTKHTRQRGPQQQQKRRSACLPVEFDMHECTYESIDPYDTSNEIHMSASTGNLFPETSLDDDGVPYESWGSSISASAADISNFRDASGLQRDVTRQQHDLYSRSTKQRRPHNQPPLPPKLPPMQPISSSGSRGRQSFPNQANVPLTRMSRLDQRNVQAKPDWSGQPVLFPAAGPSSPIFAYNISPDIGEIPTQRPVIPASAAQPEVDNYSSAEDDFTDDTDEQSTENFGTNFEIEDEYTNKEEFSNPYFDGRRQGYDTVLPGSKGQPAATTRRTVYSDRPKRVAAAASKTVRWDDVDEEDDCVENSIRRPQGPTYGHSRQNLAQGWTCSKCRLVNKPNWEENYCERCGQRRPGAVLQSHCQCLKKGRTPQWRLTQWGGETKCDKCGDWRCPLCEDVNAKSVSSCIGCGYKR